MNSNKRKLIIMYLATPTTITFAYVMRKELVNEITDFSSSFDNSSIYQLFSFDFSLASFSTLLCIKFS